ncbi:MAG: ribbon-helix-helix domain-containing protein [Nitrospinae bacterium]|nr:ribbon-helix-helix domain-containing protein [Nitrospinota bacterium]
MTSKATDHEKKVPVTTHLYQRQIDQLNQVAKELQVTKAVLFREAIEQLLKRYEEKQLDIGIK